MLTFDIFVHKNCLRKQRYILGGGIHCHFLQCGLMLRSIASRLGLLGLMRTMRGACQSSTDPLEKHRNVDAREAIRG